MKIKPIKFIMTLGCILLICFASQSAWAAVAANTSIINQASLTYNDGTGSQTIDSQVMVTVALVPGIAGLAAPADDSTPYAGVDTPLAFTFEVTANGNGPDTYTVAGTVSGSTNTSGPSVTTPASVILGATITISGSTTTVLQVPADGTANTSVNGIEVGNTVVIGGEVRQVSAITDPATGIATITLDAALSSAPGVGEPVFERQDITVTVYSGTISAAGTDITVSVDITATNSAGADTASVTATYTSGSATIVKYVRNVSWASGNTGGIGGTSFSTNGTSYTYYTSGVTGRPGDILEYVLAARNTSASPVTDCTITDVLPTTYVAFVSDVWAGTADVLYVDETGTENQLTEGADSDVATLNSAGDTLTVNVGAGAGAAVGGTIAAGISVRATYQVTINP